MVGKTGHGVGPAGQTRLITTEKLRTQSEADCCLIQKNTQTPGRSWR